MNLAILTAAILALGATAGAAHRQPKGRAKATDTTKTEADPKVLLAVNRAKSTFIFAVESCDQPERCDARFRDEAEQSFMEACKACASNETCEADRATIREGNGKRSHNPCRK